MATVRLEHVSRRFGPDRPALDGVSLEVADKEVLTVVGPSGCGKSTLLRILAGLDDPSSGEVFIDSAPMRRVAARDRNIAMVFQSYALYPHMTCRENLTLNLKLRGVAEPEVERRVIETAELLEIRDLLSKRPGELSGGQRQRVAVGRALIRKPKVFLFDEPLSNLDALLREKVRHQLKMLFRRLQATVVYVTHDQTEAMSLADRVVVLENGRVQQVGQPDDLYRHPANRFVASFIGSPSMNLFEANVEDGMLQLGNSRCPARTGVSGPVIAGIRPDAIQLVVGDAGEVLWTENLGSQVLSGVRCGDFTLTVISARRPVEGSVSIQVAPEDIYLFDAITGRNLDGGADGGSDRP